MVKYAFFNTAFPYIKIDDNENNVIQFCVGFDVKKTKLGYSLDSGGGKIKYVKNGHYIIRTNGLYIDGVELGYDYVEITPYQFDKQFENVDKMSFEFLISELKKIYRDEVRDTTQRQFLINSIIYKYAKTNDKLVSDVIDEVNVYLNK